MDTKPNQRNPAPNPLTPEPIVPRHRPWRVLGVGAAAAVGTSLFLGTQTARAAWQEISQLLSLQGNPEPVSAAVLSEHEIEVRDQMSPQSQAELLLERSINHYQGANDQIAARVGGWRGQIKLDDRLRNLFTTVLNSDDLRVRAAAIEVNIAARNLEKSPATVDQLEPDAHNGEQGLRANALWDIGLLGNRGIVPERAFARSWPAQSTIPTRISATGPWKGWLIWERTQPSLPCCRSSTTTRRP
jgi:hypothetical protein